MHGHWLVCTALLFQGAPGLDAAIRAVDQGRPARAVTATSRWQETFAVDRAVLAPTGANRYFILKPGYQLTLRGTESGAPSVLVVTVLDETREVGDVVTRVVEERETRRDELVEVSRNYLAIDNGTGDLYYFGEDVEEYRRGRVVGHEGGWRHGAGGARFGLMIPGAPVLGRRYYQEWAPGVAMDRAEVVAIDQRLTTPAGTFEDCLEIRETTPLEPHSQEYKIYAPGVGLVKDAGLVLVARRVPPSDR